MCSMTTLSRTLYLMCSMTTSSSTSSFPSLMSSMSCKSKKPRKVRQKKRKKNWGWQLSSWQMFFLGGGKCPNFGVVNVRILGVVNVRLANDLTTLVRVFDLEFSDIPSYIFLCFCVTPFLFKWSLYNKTSPPFPHIPLLFIQGDKTEIGFICHTPNWHVGRAQQ